MAKRPIVHVSESPWGEAPSEMAEAPDSSLFNLPGYSDKRREWELAKRDGEPSDPLPRRFQFVRVQRINGQDDNTKIAEYASKGYRVVRWDEASSLDIQLMEGATPVTAATKAPDGTVRIGDQILMVCSADRVARHARDLAELTMGQTDAVRARLERAADDYNTSRGLTRETGTSFELVEDESRDA